MSPTGKNEVVYTVKKSCDVNRGSFFVITDTKHQLGYLKENLYLAPIKRRFKPLIAEELKIEERSFLYISICEESFDVMFTTYHQMLYAYALTIVRDDEVARDVVQEMFLKIWKNRDRISITSSLKAFLVKATHNQCIDTIRSGKYASKHILTEQVLVRAELMAISSDEGVLDKIYSDQLQDRLRAVVETLPAQCKRIFMLNREEGMSYLEIAETLGISHSTVKNQMMIAMRKLYERLKDLI